MTSSSSEWESDKRESDETQVSLSNQFQIIELTLPHNQLPRGSPFSWVKKYANVIIISKEDLQ